jgi:hypothetical protein
MTHGFAIAALLTCAACGNALEPTRAVESAFVTDDALAARAGGPRPPPDSFETADRVVSVLDGTKARFPPSDPFAVKLVAGLDDEDAYIVLGTVFGGETGGLGAAPSYVDALRRAAAAIGADTVLDVHVEGWGLTGLAARRKPTMTDAGAW